MPDLAPGLYETLVTAALEAELAKLPAARVARVRLSGGDAVAALHQHLGRVLRVLFDAPGGRPIDRLRAILDALLAELPSDERAELSAELLPIGDGAKVEELHSIAVPVTAGAPRHAPRPRTRLSESALLTNAPNDERLVHALATELASADDVDLLCAFVRFAGVRLVEEPLAALRDRGGRLRVLTSTYMSGTERSALDKLVELGAEVRVGYEVESTRLHAKAWLLHRRSGLSTAFVGSSNLSRSAMIDGLEWNVRLSSVESPHLLAKLRATFDSYWEGGSFAEYEPARDAVALDEALRRERTDRSPHAALLRALGKIEVRPFPYQQAMLDRLAAERGDAQRSRCLVVAATGTGKTVLAALDYRRLLLAERERRGAGADLRLLFVAHRREILDQSRATFGCVLGDMAFGERLVDGDVPRAWQHVFASIQSLERRDDIDPTHFDMVIVDEFHHAAASTYERLLSRLQPRHLLGLTATPERADGQDVLHHFGGRIAAELRLWDALDQQLLCPFHYFGVSDGTDLRSVTWRPSGYDAASLERLYTADDARLRIVMQTLHRKVGDVHAMRAIGFCVSRAHAEFMARRFNDSGIPALAVLGTTDHDDRDAALRRLRTLEVNVLFAVDLYNEGVDVPEVDTLLLLRPTESATVFLQQLGRGLRKVDGKAVCTVFDFVGMQHARFRFDLRYRALTGTTRRGLKEELEQETFARLPAGCAIALDRDLRAQVLARVKSSLLRGADWTREVRRLGSDARVADVLRDLDASPEELYDKKRSWTALRRAAFPGLTPATPVGDRADEAAMLSRLRGMLHVDDAERVSLWTAWLESPTAPVAAKLAERELRLLTMLHFLLRGQDEAWRDLQGSVDQLWRCTDLREELRQLLSVNVGRRAWPSSATPWLRPVPLCLHARYTRDEVRAALGELTPARASKHREGVLYSAANALDVLFVTLRKDERYFSPSTSYKDYAISDRLFHWQSQSSTTPQSRTGQRYVRHRETGSRVALFVRETAKDERDVSQTFVCLGLCDMVSHEGSAPMSIVWRLHAPLPGHVWDAAKAVGA